MSELLTLTAAQAAERVRTGELEPAWLGTPLVQKRSLTATGTPPSGPLVSTSPGASATQV